MAVSIQEGDGQCGDRDTKHSWSPSHPTMTQGLPTPLPTLEATQGQGHPLHTAATAHLPTSSSFPYIYIIHAAGKLQAASVWGQLLLQTARPCASSPALRAGERWKQAGIQSSSSSLHAGEGDTATPPGRMGTTATWGTRERCQHSDLGHGRRTLLTLHVATRPRSPFPHTHTEPFRGASALGGS